jgi:hypothetical protein
MPAKRQVDEELGTGLEGKERSQRPSGVMAGVFMVERPSLTFLRPDAAGAV